MELIGTFAGRGKISQLVRELNGYELNGNKIRVQMSTGGGRGGEFGGMRGGGRGGRGGREGGFGRGRRDAPYPSQGRGFRHGGYGGGYGGYGRFEEDSYEESGFGGRYDGHGGYGGGPMRGYEGYGDKRFAEDYPPPMRYDGGYGANSGYEGYGDGYGAGSGGYGAPAYTERHDG